ncbi:MAG: hypothetical protein E7160_02560 [Firmicutes bacterium]|nr:hypothetical protein [Bacillota bacterium]
MNIIIRHKKALLLLIIISSVFTIYKTNNKNNISYISIGDGYSKGIDSYYQINYGYSDYLRDHLKKNNILNKYNKSFTDKNASIDSLYKDIVINRKVKDNNFKQTLRESEILTMSIGINDLIYRLALTEDMDEYKLNRIITDIDKSLNILIKEIRKYYQKDIYIIGYYKPNTSNYYLLKGIDKLNELYKNNKNVIYIYSENINNNPLKYLSNPSNNYPNSIGYKEISTEIVEKITKKLAK